MKLNNKILLGFSLVWLLFLIAAYSGARLYLLESYRLLEQESADRDLVRVQKSLDQMIISLKAFTHDWSHWGEGYAFIKGNNPSFIRNNFLLSTFLASDIHFLGYFDNYGRLLAGAAIDSRAGRFMPYPAGLVKYLYPGYIFSDFKDKFLNSSGYLALPEGMMMFAIDEVTDGKEHTAAIGRLIAGRFLSGKMLNMLRQLTQLDLELLPAAELSNTRNTSTIYRKLVGNRDARIIHILNDDVLQGYIMLRDIFGQPVAALRMTETRRIYHSGQSSLHYFLGIYVLFGFVATIIFMILVRLLVIRRLEKLNRGIAAIGETSRLEKRVHASGKDELTSVAGQINKMMDVIQASHDVLEESIIKRTDELRNANLQLLNEIHERKFIESELQLHKDNLERLAHYDGLTSLPNRMYFNLIAAHEILMAKQEGKKLAVLFIDLDRFKNINDAFGHQVGDHVLSEAAKRMSRVLGKDDVMARLGGDEFIILSKSQSTRESMDAYAEQLVNTLTQSISYDHHQFYLSVSIGISVYPDDGATLELLQSNADMAMYECKRHGGRGYRYYSKRMTSKANEKIRMDYDLRKAIENNEFVLYYQPKYYLPTRKIAGAEALIRWNHPELGIVNPTEFIPHAEESGMILQIGEWALTEACRACQSWPRAGFDPLSVAVNLSVRQFKQDDFVERVACALRVTDLDAKCLELEVTESAMMDNIDEAARKLMEVRKLNVTISIDDFGTGYTSIGYLNKLPVSILKIDRNFINGIPFSQSDMTITSAVIALAHNLGIKVVAEGVESLEQLQWLTEHKCDMVQGYYLSRPLNESDFLAELERKATSHQVDTIIETA